MKLQGELSSGNYWVGDLGFVMPPEIWNVLCPFQRDEKWQEIFDRYGIIQIPISENSKPRLWKTGYLKSSLIEALSGTIGILPDDLLREYENASLTKGYYIELTERTDFRFEEGNLFFGNWRIKI